MIKSYKILLVLIILLMQSALVLAEPIKVGAIIPLSGAVAPWGERVRIGLETANQLQSSPLDFVIEDEGPCEAQKALTAYRKLVSVDRVKIIFVSCLAGTEAIAPLAARDSVLLLSLGLLKDSVLSSNGMLVNLATEIGTEAKLLSAYVAEAKPKKLAGIFFADSFGQEFSQVMAETLEQAGVPFITRDEADAQTQSFKSLIIKWKSQKVDTLVTTLADRQQLALIREMQELNFNPKIFSTYILECFAPAVENRKYYEGIKFTHPVNSSEANQQKIDFEKSLAAREKPGQASNINALFAYDGITLLLKGLKQCVASDTPCLRNYFMKLGKQSGVSGQMNFKQNGALERPYGLKVVQAGEFVWLKR